MKGILLLFLGIASVLSANGLDYAAKEKRVYIDVKTELGKTLKENLHKIFQEISDSLDQGLEVTSKLLQKAKDLVQKLKDLGVDIEDKTKNVFKDIRDKAKDWLKEALDNLGLSKNRPKHTERSLLDRADLKIIFLKIMEMISDKIDVEKIILFIENNLGDFNELADILVETIRHYGQHGLLEMLNRILGVESSGSRRAFNPLELWDKIKDFFKDSGISFMKFLDFRHFFQWVLENAKKVLDSALPYIEKIKWLANEFIDQMEVVGKDIAREAIGFFGLYKKDLGDLFTRMEKKFNQLFG